MKQSKMPADPNRRAKGTADIVDAILNGETPAKDPERVARGERGEGRKGPSFEAHPGASFGDRSEGGSGSLGEELALPRTSPLG
jgi:hypothetical protein